MQILGYVEKLVELVFILLLIGGLAFWWRSTLSRENAVRFARRACGQCGVQLLDETVALGKLRLQRSNKGHMGIARWYTFEFSTSGADRRPGVVSLLGDQLLDMHLQLDMEELAESASSTNGPNNGAYNGPGSHQENEQ